MSPRLPRRLRELVPAGDPDLDRYLRWSGSAAALVTALWLWLQLDLLDQRVFGNFYDIQARALLAGDLAVPDGALGNEAFAVRGHEFLYNPPGPSFLRLPVLVVTDRFDGRLTVASMFLAWVLAVVVIVLLVWRIRRMLRPGTPLSTSEAAIHAGFLVVATVGSTLLYLGAVPWVFHEAYAWAIACCLGAAFCLLGVLQRPSIGSVVGTGVFTFGALFSRAPAGLACAIAGLAAAGWLWRGGRGDAGREVWWRLGVAVAVPVVLSVAVNWAKFRHPVAFPIDEQVFTGLSRSRRDAIAANGGDLFGLDLIRSTVPAYLRPDGIRVSNLFPYISLPPEPAPTYGGSTFDLTYRTGSIVAFMPALVLLSVLGVLRAFGRRAREAERLLRLPLIGLALVPAGIMIGAYIAHRYTSEFVPFLVLAGAVGAVDLAERLPAWSRDNRAVVLGVVGLAAAFGVAANLAVAVSTQALANPGATLADHLDRQERFSGLAGGDLQDHLRSVTDLPESAPADEVHIVGECQAVYVGTGETFTPWVEAGIRPLALDVVRTTQAGTTPSGELPLAEWVGHRRTQLLLAREGGRYRLVLDGGGRSGEGDWVELAPGEEVRIEVRTDRVDEYVITMEGSEAELRVSKESHDVEWFWRPDVLTPLVDDGAPLVGEGVQVTATPTASPPGCEERLERLRASAAP